ncbi:MAG: hypothetical protein ACLFRI_00740 [Candidatus Izemoplasmataceae bacterium]
MKEYDVIVIGSGVASLTAASYLSKRLRDVALFVIEDDTKIMTSSKRYADKDRKRYTFNTPYYEFGGLEKGALLSYYLNRLGIEEKFKVAENKETIILKNNGRIISRPNDVHGFKLYLVRHYPKSRDQIHLFFDTLTKFYEDYKTQRLNNLRGKVFTLTALNAHWGNKSLKMVLQSYFKDPELLNEFGFMHHTVGLDLNEINAVHYFIRWFNIFMEKSYFIQNTYEELNTLFMHKNTHETIVRESIKEVVIEDNKIVKIVTKNGEYKADFYIINDNPKKLINTYIKENKGLLEEALPSVFKQQAKYRVNTAMIGLNKPLKALGLNHVKYVFEPDLSKDIPFLSLVDYTYIDPKSAPKGYSTLLVEFIDKEDYDEETFTLELSRYLDKLEESITLIRFGEAIEYRGSYDTFFEKQKTLNDLYDLDLYQPLNVFDNTYFVGSFYRPEAGITGLLQMGVEIGDIVNDALDNKELDMPLVSHDELINIIAHQFIPKSLGQKEKYIVFVIGKSSYTLRAKGKYLEIYRYAKDDYDLLLSATNETFYNLTARNLTLQEALKSNSLEYQGSETFLKEVFEAFNLGKERTVIEYEKNAKPYGLLSFYSTMFLFTVFSILSFYVPLLVLIPVTLFLMVIKIIFTYHYIKKFITYDFIISALWLIYLFLTIFEVEHRFISTEIFIALNTFYWFITWLIKKPIIYTYVYKDYRSDFVLTPFFVTMMGGLSFIWMLTLAIGFLSTYYLDTVNQTIGFYTVLIAFYLTHRYPRMYVRSTIKNRK